MKIMCVDDDPDVIFVLETFLSRCGCEVVGVTDAKQCLEIVKREKPDLIFLDVMMQDVSGWELCKQIKEDPLTSGIIVAMLTGSREEEDVKMSLEEAKANLYLTKPINLTEIRDIVGELFVMEARQDSLITSCEAC